MQSLDARATVGQQQRDLPLPSVSLADVAAAAAAVVAAATAAAIARQDA